MHRSVLPTTLLFALCCGVASARPPAEPSATPESSAPPTASAAATRAPASQPRITAVDGAFSLPGGIWKCETLGNSPASSVYKLENATTISERTLLQLPKRPRVELDSLFSFNRARGVWTVLLEHGVYAGTAPVWSGDTWTFDGTYAEGGEKKPVRLVYTSLGQGALRVDYQAATQGRWRTFSGATCKRTIP